MKTLGIILIVAGALLVAITGFNFVTKEKVVDLGPLEINKEKEHSIQWSPILGAALLIGGVVVVATSRKNA